MIQNVFEYQDYKAYLRATFASRGETRGMRSKLALTLGCQTTFISQVLNGKTHFSLEHALQITRFLGHSEGEQEYFLLLVYLGRAGTRALQDYYLKHVRAFLRKREAVSSRIPKSRTLSEADQMTYYGVWYYSAIHIALLVPALRTRDALAKHFQLPPARVTQCLDFLVSKGLAVKDGGTYRSGASRIHLGRESPMLMRHHANWRMRAIESIDRDEAEDLHFSSVMSVSEDAFRKIKTAVLETIEKSEPVIWDAKDEGVYCFLIDLFRT